MKYGPYVVSQTYPGMNPIHPSTTNAGGLSSPEMTSKTKNTMLVKMLYNKKCTKRKPYVSCTMSPQTPPFKSPPLPLRLLNRILVQDIRRQLEVLFAQVRDRISECEG